MRTDKKRCNSASFCPCYPNCDQMMKEKWEAPKKESEMPFLHRELFTGMADGNTQELKELAEQDEKDLMMLKEMYPSRVREILGEVEQVCDSLEYEGSAMFDEMPEKQRVQELSKAIRQKMQSRMDEWEQEQRKKMEEDIYVCDHKMAPPYPGKRPEPRKECCSFDWFGDLIQVLLWQEMYHRRCRNRNCRKW